MAFTDEAIVHIIRHYTREAGVRNLEREIANVCRKVARKVVKEGKSLQVTVRPEDRAGVPGRYKVPGHQSRRKK